MLKAEKDIARGREHKLRLPNFTGGAGPMDPFKGTKRINLRETWSLSSLE